MTIATGSSSRAAIKFARHSQVLLLGRTRTAAAQAAPAAGICAYVKVLPRIFVASFGFFSEFVRFFLQIFIGLAYVVWVTTHLHTKACRQPNIRVRRVEGTERQTDICGWVGVEQRQKPGRNIFFFFLTSLSFDC